MAKAPAVTWRSLSPPARRAFEIAAALAESEPTKGDPSVKSEHLLIGIDRAERSASEPHQLLSHVGLSREDLLRRLPGRVDLPKRIKPLKAFPALSANTEEAVAAAARLRNDLAAPRPPLELRHLFGGILSVEESVAYRVLESLVGDRISLRQLRKGYPEFLGWGPKARFRDFLKEYLPYRPAPPGEVPSDETPGAFTRDAPYLARIEHEGSAVGVAVAPDLVVTTVEGLSSVGFQPDPDTGVTVVLADGSRVDALVQAVAEEMHLVLLRIVDLPTSLATDQLPRVTGEEVQEGRRCESFEMSADGFVRRTGVVRGVERDRRLVLRFREQPPSGAPVLDGDGALIGIVWAGDGRDTLAVSANVLGEEPFGLKLAEAEPPAEPERDGPLVGTFRGAGNDAIAKRDQLAFEHYANAFARLIESPYTKPPLTIGIYGSWGIGKSFLLNQIKEKLINHDFQSGPRTADSPPPHVHVVFFNAWAYSAAEVIWPGLVRRIMETLEDKIEWGFPGRFLRKLWRNLVRELRVAQGRLVLIAAILVVAFLLAYWQADFSAAAVGAVIAALGLGGLVKLVSDTLTDPLGRWVSKLVEEGDYGKQIGYMEQTKRDLDDLGGRLLEDNGRILVVIDDLDRCEPDRAVEVLQAINLLLNFEIFVVCLGIDARVITAAVEKHYEGVLGEAGASGYEYLDKIVQIPFRIPRPSEDEIKTFLAFQLDPELAKDGDGSGPTGLGALTELIETEPEPEPEPGPEHEPAEHGTAPDAPPSSDLPDTPAHEMDRDSGEPEAEFTDLERQAFEAAAPHMRANPRHLKRLVNVYRLVRDLAHSKGERAILDNPAATIRWLVMCAQWPYTAQAMLDRFNELLDEWGGKIPDHPPSGDPLVHLLADVEPSLVQDRLRELDGDLPSLRQLLAWQEGELSWAELSRVRHYTVNFNPAVETELRRGMRPTAQTPAPSANGQTPGQQAATTASAGPAP